MLKVCVHAKMFDLPLMDHCQDYDLVGNGVMNEGHWSNVLGLPGWPAAGEEIIVARNIQMAELTGTHIHCQHMILIFPFHNTPIHELKKDLLHNYFLQ